jgi:hypothetical protein
VCYGVAVIADRPVWVTIPTIGYSELLIPLVNELERDLKIDKIILTVNREEYVEPVRSIFQFAEPTVEIIETWPQGMSLHHGWNYSIEMARKENAWLAVLNDDIRLLGPNYISYVAGLLAGNPRYAILGLEWLENPGSAKGGARPLRKVSGSYRHCGVGGFAWVCDPHKVVLVPEDYIWWYGDDHIFFSAEKAKYRLGIATQAGVEHVNSMTSRGVASEWTEEARANDTEVFRRIWPGK